MIILRNWRNQGGYARNDAHVFEGPFYAGWYIWKSGDRPNAGDLLKILLFGYKVISNYCILI